MRGVDVVVLARRPLAALANGEVRAKLAGHWRSITEHVQARPAL
jgi:hypothetical protein